MEQGVIDTQHSLAFSTLIHRPIWETPVDPQFVIRVGEKVGRPSVHIETHVSVVQRIDGTFPCIREGELSDTSKDQGTWK